MTESREAGAGKSRAAEGGDLGAGENSTDIG